MSNDGYGTAPGVGSHIQAEQEPDALSGDHSGLAIHALDQRKSTERVARVFQTVDWSCAAADTGFLTHALHPCISLPGPGLHLLQGPAHGCRKSGWRNCRRSPRRSSRPPSGGSSGPDARAGRPAKTAYVALVSGVPVWRAVFALYHATRTLHYVKLGCSSADTARWFFRHLIPATVNDLAGHRPQHGFDSLDFHFRDPGVSFDSKWRATIALPPYSITRIRIGQFVLADHGFDHIGEAEIRLVEQCAGLSGPGCAKRHNVTCVTLPGSGFQRLRATIDKGSHAIYRHPKLPGFRSHAPCDASSRPVHE